MSANFQALGKFCSDRKAFSTLEHRHVLQEKWATYLKQYRNYMSDSYPGRAKIHIPQTFATTFRLYSAIMSNVRRNKDIVRYIPEARHDDAQIQSVIANEGMQQAVSYYMAKSRALREISKWELEACTMGTSFLKTTWEFKEADVPGRSISPETAQIEKKVIYDGPRFEHRPIYSIYIDPKVINTTSNVDEMEYIIDERYDSLDNLFSNPKFFNKERVLRKRITEGSAVTHRDDDNITMSLDEATEAGFTGIESRDKQSDMVLVEEYWGRVPEKLLSGQKQKSYDNSDLKGFVEGHVILVEGVVIFAEENPYPNGRKPYDVIRCYPVADYFYGIGIPELIKDLQRAINAISNQRIDNVSLVLNRMWGYRENMINPKTLISRPGGFIPIRGGTSVRDALMPIDTPDVTSSAYREHEIYDNTIQKISGVADIFFGHSAGTTRISATEATFMTEMGAGMMEEIVAGQVQDGFIPIMEKVRDYVQEFMTGTLPVKIHGQSKVLRASDLSGDFELIPTIGEQMFTKTAEMQKAMMLLKTTLEVREILMQEGKTVSVSTILERIYENAGWKDFPAIVSGSPQGDSAKGQAQEVEEGLGGSELPGNSGGTTPGAGIDPGSLGAIPGLG